MSLTGAGFFLENLYMDPNNLQFGSGSSLLGGTDALNEAMQRRQTGQAGATDQQTMASAGANPATQISPSSNTTQAPTNAPSIPQNASLKGLPYGDPDAALIVKALSKRLNG